MVPYFEAMAKEAGGADRDRLNLWKTVPLALVIIISPVVGLTLGLLAPNLGSALPLLAGVGLAFPHGMKGLSRILANPVRRRPRKPIEMTPRRPYVGREPKTTILEPSDRCTICGRPLTNPQSQLARVGMECIKKHGPRYLSVPNPAHHAWRAAMAQADAAWAHAKAAARNTYTSELQRYRQSRKVLPAECGCRRCRRCDSRDHWGRTRTRSTVPQGARRPARGGASGPDRRDTADLHIEPARDAATGPTDDERRFGPGGIMGS